MKCVLCGRRKGKRHCPAKSDLICAQCCGEKRILEVDCPETCEFLKIGRNHQIREYAYFLENIPPSKWDRRDRVLRDWRDVVAHVEWALAGNRLSLRDLTDKDVAEALDLLADAYRTEEKGILYEKSASDLRVDSLRRELRGVIESHRNPSQGADEGLVGSREARLPLASAIECLDFIRDLVASHMDSGDSPTSYVDLLARIIPREPQGTNARSSIIMP